MEKKRGHVQKNKQLRNLIVANASRIMAEWRESGARPVAW